MRARIPLTIKVIPLKASSSSSPSANPWQDFITQATMFVQQTSEHALQGINPGGVYQAIWWRRIIYSCRLVPFWQFSRRLAANLPNMGSSNSSQ